MLNKNHAQLGDKSPIITGRYGVFEGTPIVALWHTQRKDLIKKVIQAIKPYIHSESLLYIGGNYAGQTISKPKIPERKRKGLEQEVNISGKNYHIYELPGLLHTLPSNSSEFHAIADFICKNHEKFPILKNFLTKARCAKSNYPHEPEWVRRRRHWPTSESFKYWLMENDLRTGAKLGLYPPIADALGQYPPLYAMASAADLITYIDIAYKGKKIPGKDGIIKYEKPREEHAQTTASSGKSFSSTT
jgi:hypothetical protein